MLKVHPIQQRYEVTGDRTVKCQICGEQTTAKYPTTNHRALFVVHLVKRHLEEVNRTFTRQGMAEEIWVEERE